MGEYNTPLTFFGNLWSENFSGSGEYTPSVFIPTVYTFDIDPDSLELTNVEVETLGTPIPNSGRAEALARRYNIGEFPRIGLWWDTHTGLGIYTYYSPFFRISDNVDKWLAYRNHGWWASDNVKGDNLYFGAYFHRPTQSTYILATVVNVDGTYNITALRNIERTAGYSNWTAENVLWLKNWILKMFYGVDPLAPKISIERISPESDIFNVGQSSVLQYQLVNELDEVLSDTPDSIVVETGTGWGYSEETHTLRYLQGDWKSYAKVTFTYDGVEYSLNDTFYPVAYQQYGPGGTSSGNIGGNGSFSGPGGSWGNGIGPSPSTNVKGDVPNGSAESNSSSTGLFTRYAMNATELQSVGAALYTENILEQATKAVMSFLWNSPSEALISLISYPFDVTSLLSTTQAPVIFGAIDLGPIEAVSGSRLNGTFAQIDWGSIQLSEYWGNFLDYAPHTKIELYLPWCTGSVSIDPHECLPGSISVITNIEISKGTCVHNVFGNKGALIGTYSGTCGSQLPMTALDTAGKALALVTAAAGALVAGAAAGGAASAGIAAANSPHTAAMAYSLENSRGLEPMAARLTAQKEAMAMAEAPYKKIEKRATQTSLVSSVAAFRTPATIQRNGSFTGNGAGMAIQFPFIIVSRPEQNIPQNYGRFFGYPSNVYTTLGSVSGYTEVGSVHVNGLTGATLDEVEEVERLLKGGVIL